MDKKRIFRALVCLALVCCLLVNVSPMKSKASVIIGALTAYEVAGYLALALATTVGAVYIVNNREEVAAVGQKVLGNIQIGDEPGEEESLNHVYELTKNIQGCWDAGGDGSGFDPRLGTKLAQGLLAAMAGSVVTSIAAGSMEAEVEEEVEVEIPEGFASYNGHILPVFTAADIYPNYYIFLRNGVYRLEARSDHINVYDNGNDSYYWEYYPDGYSISLYASFDPTSSATFWQVDGTGSVSGGRGIVKGSLVYSSCDIRIFDCDYIDGEYIYTDTGMLFISGSSPITSDYTTTEKKTITIDPIYVGDLPTQIENGDLDEEESKKKILAPLPDYIDITKIIESPETAPEEFSQWQQEVAEGQKSLEEALEDITGELDDIQDDITQPDTGTDTGLLEQILSAIQSLAKAIVDPILNGIKSLFVPAPGYIDAKIADLTDKYDFAKQIADSGIEFKDWFMNLGETPPIIYIDLGAARGFYNMGGKVVLMDMTWYEEYKPTVDGILSSFLWLWFIWRILLSLPGIIQGTSGFWNKVDSDAGANYAPDPQPRYGPRPRGFLGTSEYSQKGGNRDVV